jgi:hypothetical protein
MWLVFMLLFRGYIKALLFIHSSILPLLRGVRGMTPGKVFEILHARTCILEHFGAIQCVYCKAIFLLDESFLHRFF